MKENKRHWHLLSCQQRCLQRRRAVSTSGSTTGQAPSPAPAQTLLRQASTCLCPALGGSSLREKSGGLRGVRTRLRQDAPRGEQRPAVGMASSCQRAARLLEPRQLQCPCGHGFPARSSQEVPRAAGGGEGSLPPGLCWQRDTELIPAPFKHPSDPEAASPPATSWDRVPGKGPRGEEICTCHNFSSRPDTRSHPHPHPHTPPSATERSVEPVSRTRSPFVQGSHVTVRPGRGSDGWDIVQESM